MKIHLTLKKYHFIFLLIICHSTFGQTSEVDGAQSSLSITRTAKGDIELKANNCDSLVATLKSLSDWSHNLGESGCKPIPLTYLKQNNQCKTSIKSCLPASVQTLFGRKPKVVGPNCFNAALTVQKMGTYLRESGTTEFSHIIESPLCKPIKDSKLLRAGDIGAIRTFPQMGAQEVHAFIYISPQLSFSKFDMSNNSAYEIHDLNVDLKGYNVAASYQCGNSRGIESPDACTNKVEYFRCKPIEQLKVSLHKKYRTLKDLDAEITLFEKNLALENWTGDLISKISATLLTKVPSLVVDLSKLNLNSLEKFYVGTLFYRLDGAIKQHKFNLTSDKPAQSIPPHFQSIERQLDELFQLSFAI